MIQLVLYNIYTKVSHYEKQLEPFYELARQRIELTNNRLNVSDQLIGYRNNLNCINPTKYTTQINSDRFPPINCVLNESQGFRLWRFSSSDDFSLTE
ncbi:unnamed protein product [Trichobilharzia regenti]|nr:unnamed protein product [Trichobilharzia regenti]